MNNLTLLRISIVAASLSIASCDRPHRTESPSEPSAAESPKPINPFIGKWADRRNSDTIEFFGDGAVILRSGEQSWTAEYQIASDTIVTTNLPALLPGMSKMTLSSREGFDPLLKCSLGIPYSKVK